MKKTLYFIMLLFSFSAQTIFTAEPEIQWNYQDEAIKRSRDYDRLLEANLKLGLHIDDIKAAIAESPHRVKDWNDKYLKNIEWLYTIKFPGENPPIEKIKTIEDSKISNCFESAIFMARLLGVHRKDFNFFINPIRSHLFYNVPLPSDLYCTTFEKLITKKGSRYTDFAGSILLNHTGKSTHRCFFISIISGTKGKHHHFIIEQIGNKKENKYRAFHSWFNTYTLAEWVGVDPWDPREINTDLKEMYENFGKGQYVDTNQIIWFLENFIPDLWNGNKASSYPYYIGIFNLKRNGQLIIHPKSLPDPISDAEIKERKEAPAAAAAAVQT